MVEIRRKNKVKETFHIADNDGRELTVECVLDPGEALPAFNRARNSIIRAQTAKQPILKPWDAPFWTCSRFSSERKAP